MTSAIAPAPTVGAAGRQDGGDDLIERLLPSLVHLQTNLDADLRSGVEPVGMPFVHYLEMSDDRVVIEVGVPVRSRFSAVGRVHPYQLPGGTVAVGQHYGPYEQIGESYDALGRWVGEHDRQPAGAMWEVYATDPQSEPDPDKWRTEIFWPVR